MNNENIKEILDKLKDENNYQVDCNDGSAFKELFANDINLLLDYITNLQEEIHKKEAMYDSLAVDYRLAQEKIDQYENPDDLTLFYMWLDAKAKDKMKELETINTSLKQTNAMLSLLGENYKTKCENAKIYIKEHSNNLIEYLDVFEVKDLWKILEGDEE